MATKVLLPGFGGRVTQVLTVGQEGTVYSDTFDTSRCASLAVQISGLDPDDIDVDLVVERSFDGVNFAPWLSLNSGALGGILSSDDLLVAPIGLIRVGVSLDDSEDSSESSGYETEVTLTVTGFQLQT